MNRFILLCLLSFALLFCKSSYAHDPGSVLKIALKDGTTQVIQLQDKPILKFTTEGVTISTTSVVFSYDRIERLYFERISTSIQAPTASDQHLSVNFTDNHLLRIGGLKSEDRVWVYGLDGHQANVPTTYDADELVLDFTGLASGTYIVKNRIKTFKIFKR